VEWTSSGLLTENAELKGKVLIVYPADVEARTEKDFFTKSPKRQTALVVQRIQALPDRITPSLHYINLWP